VRDVDPVHAADAVPGSEITRRTGRVEVAITRVIFLAAPRRERTAGVVVVVDIEEGIELRVGRNGYESNQRNNGDSPQLSHENLLSAVLKTARNDTAMDIIPLNFRPHETLAF